MSDRTPTTLELSRAVPVERIGTRWQRYPITADAAERAALARRFELLDLPALDAQVRLRRARAGRYVKIEGTVRASVVQSCVVTLDPVPASFEERFELMLGPIDGTPDEAGASDLIVDLDDPEPLDGDSIDIGELVAQQLSLALDPYPRSAAAGDSVAISTADPEPAPADNPFAALSARRKPR